MELHCHTKMSDMDGVSEVSAILKAGEGVGTSRRLAITDHGAVQAFPDANHTSLAKTIDFKVIYGMEAYLVDDLKEIAVNTQDSRS